jgi:outer membrane protein assembly factor BamB
MQINSTGIQGLAVLMLATAGFAQTSKSSWVQWRGPDRTGVSTETGWRATGQAEALWTKNVGMGYSTVSIADGRLYTQGHDKEKQVDTIVCLDALTGEEIWAHTLPAKTMSMAHRGGTLSTPSIDDKVVWASNREGNFFRLDAKKGKVLWKTNLIKKHGARLPTWGLSAAPVVLDEMILMNVGPVIAFDRKGKVLWKTKDYGHAYATPADFTFENKRFFAVFSSSGLTVVARKSGKEVATSKWKTRYDVNAATPIVAGNKIFISSGYNHGCSLLEFDGEKLKTLWENKSMRNHMSGCVLYEDHLYGFDESTVKCLDLGGETKWAQRGLGKGALLLADGKLIMISGRGDLVIAKATSKKFEEISRQKVLSGGVKWTTPVLCGGLIYVRGSMGELVCLDRRANSPPKSDPKK